MSGDHGWVEKAARRLAGDAGGGRAQAGAADPTPRDRELAPEDQLSRASAVKLGVAAGASVMLGLWRVPEGSALDINQCKGDCYERVLDRSLKDTQFCRRLYNDAGWKSDAKSWARVREIINEGGWKTLAKITQQSLAQACESVVAKRALNGFDKCDDACEIACGKSRSLAGKSSPRQVCKPPDPPKPYTPAPPPAPNMTEDPCWSCVEVGGQCCGPFTGDPATGVTPCACATPGVECEVYGCG